MKLQACISCLIVFYENFFPVFFKAQDHVWDRCSVISACAMTDREQPWQDEGDVLQIESTAFGACAREMVAWGGQAVRGGLAVVPLTGLCRSVVCSSCSELTEWCDL